MADPLGNVEKIVKVALMIKEAVDKVRKNKEECHEIRKRVVRVSALLTRLQETEMMKDPATGSTLQELEVTLTLAHELVTACQRKNVLSRFCRAGDLAKQLREVKQDISDLMVDGIFATNVNATIILTNIQFAASVPHQKDAGVNLRSSHRTDSDRSDMMKSEK
ncbi:hypothetical protein BS78_05G234600 [Paspalum vaginatum]|nr:hypothetical protein BS78_05G234600 [Paspalum vaginatum]